MAMFAGNNRSTKKPDLSHYNFSYVKNDNTVLFDSFTDISKVNLAEMQNYIPLYHKYFVLNESNYNNINLRHHVYIRNILEQNYYNSYKCKIETDKGHTKTVDVFFKFSPLIDPVKYLTDQYKDKFEFGLPSLRTVDDKDSSKIHPKINDPNNSSYIDSFFYYLSSILRKKMYFVHGLEFFGSFLAKHKMFRYNIYHDLEDMFQSIEFLTNRNKKYVIRNDILELNDFGSSKGTRDNRTNLLTGKKLVLKEKIELGEKNSIDDIIQVDTIEVGMEGLQCGDKSEMIDKDTRVSLSLTEYNLELMIKNMKCDGEKIECIGHGGGGSNKSAKLSDTDGSFIMSECSSRSSRSSRSSHSEHSSYIISENGKEGVQLSPRSIESYSDSDEEGDSDLSVADDIADEEIYVEIFDFPTQVICTEQMEETLDSLMVAEALEPREWKSCLLQIIAMLIVYRKVFDLTHNDLHTNNIMYNSTEKKFLYYKIDGTYYKVPTYGKLYKIIDFGRATYSFNGQKMCSDSFHPRGDAATQYNMEPYFNDKKPRLEPNDSFDLCRLGCAMFDFFDVDYDEEDEEEDENYHQGRKSNFVLKFESIKSLVHEWCTDDKGRNILYKKNGEERYPDFKLYKMIARTASKHTPIKQLKNKVFAEYKTTRKKINRKQKVMNVDTMPSLI